MSYANRREILKTRVTLLTLFGFLSLSSWPAFSQEHSEVRFEQLCRDFTTGAHSSAREALLEFTQNFSQSPLATLGYYLIGYQDLQKGHLESALDALEHALVGADQVPIADFILYHHAEVLHQLNRPTQAIEGWQTYLRQFPRGHLAKQAIRYLWEEALLVGDPQLIFQSQKDWPHLSKSTEALYYAAAAYESVGETRQATDRYLRLHYRFPLSPASSMALKALTRLRLDYPDESFEVPQSWKKVRAEKLFKGKRYHDAIDALEAVLESGTSPPERSKLLLWKGISEFHARKQQESLQTLKTLPTPFAQQPQAWFYQAENYRRLDDYDSFKQTVKRLQQHYPRSSWLERAWFSLGNSRLVRRELDQAHYFYQQLIDHFSSGSRARNAHWRVAWYHYRKRKRKKALSLFVEHLQRFPRSPHRPSALYWSARSKEHSGEPRQARLLYQAITEVFSNHYYAHLSRNHLDRLNPEDTGPVALDPHLSGIVARLKREATARFSSDTAKLPDRPARLSSRVKALRLIQLFEAAAREFLRTSPGSRATQFQAATLFHQGSHFRSSTYYLQRLFPGFVYRPFASLSEDVWRMLFPIKYASLFATEAQKHQIDPYLLAALVRQESAFDREAVSPAMARGLMQLIPETARRVAHQLGLQNPSPTQLYDPPLNIRLGSQYFADRLEQFNGDVDQALASYNAGPHRVRLWLSEGNYEEPAEFVENIPFTETRNYVKIFHRNYWFYKRLYDESVWQQGP